MARYVLGDLHGAYKALVQVLERASFNPQDDMLILLGDLCDGWSQTRECIDFLLTVPNLVFVLGNHDRWFVDYMKTGEVPSVWYSQGGAATLASYGGAGQPIPEAHKAFFTKYKLAYELDHMVFVHGGFDPRYTPVLQGDDVLLWDRTLIQDAWKNWKFGNPKQYGSWQKIFLGHTSVTRYGFDTPPTWGNVVGMDTGAGWEGPLSLMDIDTGEFFQSDYSFTFYPDEAGRRG